MIANAAMPPWAVIPVKPFHLGKTRLRLSQSERIALTRSFLRHVLGVVTAVLPATHVIIVSRDEQALTMARSMGARALLEGPHGDLNMALTEGARFAGERGAGSVLSIASDLPALTVDDVSAMLDALPGHDVVMAPDEQGTGTNAMLMAPNLLPYRHGVGSLWRHLEAARDADLRFLLLRRDGLMHDVDTPEQLPLNMAARQASTLKRPADI